jgi:hypothetical protein
MQKPKRVENRTIWDRIDVDRAFDLFDGGSARDSYGEEVISLRRRALFTDRPRSAAPSRARR